MQVLTNPGYEASLRIGDDRRGQSLVSLVRVDHCLKIQQMREVAVRFSARWQSQSEPS